MAEEEEVKTEAPPKKSKKMLIIGGIAGLVLVIGAPALYFTVFKKSAEEPTLPTDIALKEETAGLIGNLEEDELEEGEEPLGAIYPLDSFVLNLSDGKFIRTQVQLEFSGNDIPRRFYNRSVILRDALIKLITKKSSDELLDESGKNKLKEEIKQTINDVLKREEVKNVYFTQFVIQ
jgi:flagellar FliL protein